MTKEDVTTTWIRLANTNMLDPKMNKSRRVMYFTFGKFVPTEKR